MNQKNQMNKTPVIIGSDHAGFPLKEKVKQFIIGLDIAVQDAGTNSPESVDYTDYGINVASAVSKADFQRGILVCGTGLGMSMIANRFANVRAALCNDSFSTAMSRRHNDSNILVLGGRVIGDALGIELVKIWLETPFEGGRHLQRIEKFEIK